MSAIAVLAQVVAYVGMTVFLVAVVVRCLLWARMPMHLRWELYPVAHEGGGRARYGGSCLELPRWWTQPRQVSRWGEITAMASEILFLVALREHNPKLWLRSFPFHLGLYLVAACTTLMMVLGVLHAVTPRLLSGTAGQVLALVVPISGGLGLTLGLLGAIGLLHRRLVVEELRVFSAPVDFFNLMLFIGVFGFALATFALVDPRLAAAQAFVERLVTLRPGMVEAGAAASVLVPISAILLSALAAYIPLTHMSHFIGKYFAYHSVRWNDEPNLVGGEWEATIEGLLQRPVSWAAPHIRGDGTTSWADAAADEAKR